MKQINKAGKGLTRIGEFFCCWERFSAGEMVAATTKVRARTLVPSVRSRISYQFRPL